MSMYFSFRVLLSKINCPDSSASADIKNPHHLRVGGIRRCETQLVIPGQKEKVVLQICLTHQCSSDQLKYKDLPSLSDSDASLGIWYSASSMSGVLPLPMFH